MNKFIIKNNGFTIVETLVAVAILMISIAGPLTIAQKGLMAAIYARDQVTATFLAQEKMEEIKNTRDGDAINASFTDFVNLIVNPNLCSNPLITPVLLNIDGNGMYSDATGLNNPSRFSRSYCFARLAKTDPNYDNEVTAVVRVIWSNGTIDNEVKLENELFNIQK